MDEAATQQNAQLCISLAARPSNFGKRFHNYLYSEFGRDFIYKAFTTTDIAGAIGGVRALGIRGCSVSIPFEEDVLTLVDEIDASARAIRSIYTIVNDDGCLRAFNTDYIAIAELIRRHKVDPATPFLLRGSGGMSKAVAAAFRDAGFANGTLIARNESTGRVLANELGYRWAERPDGLTAPLIINVTPIGMAGAAESTPLSFSSETIAEAPTVFDVVALPAETPLITASRAAGSSPAHAPAPAHPPHTSTGRGLKS